MLLFVLALAAQAATPAVVPNLITTPNWITKPTAMDLAQYYPLSAQQKNLDGVVTFSCTIRADGTLDACTVVREFPKGENFGDAALKLSKLFRMSPTTADGKSVAGGTVRVPIRFVLPGSPVLTSPELATVATCYGQLANQAETNPADLEAWRGTAYWYVQGIGMAAIRYQPPSSVETAMAQARQDAANGVLKPAAGYDLKSCMAKVPKQP